MAEIDVAVKSRNTGNDGVKLKDEQPPITTLSEQCTGNELSRRLLSEKEEISIPATTFRSP